MRGTDQQQTGMFSYISAERRLDTQEVVGVSIFRGQTVHRLLFAFISAWKEFLLRKLA